MNTYSIDYSRSASCSSWRAKPWYCQISYLAMFAFIVVLPFLKAWGIRPLLVMGLTCVAIWLQLNKNTSVAYVEKPKELYYYTFWAIWAIVTGGFIYVGWYEFFENAKMVLRSMALIWVAFAIFAKQRQHSYYYWAIWGVAMIHAVASTLGYHVEASSDVLNPDIVQDVFDANVRIEGLTGNANAMGIAMLAGIWASILLWRDGSDGIKLIRWVILLAAIVIFSYFIIHTASRKSLMVECILISGWLMWMLPGRMSLKSFLLIGLMGLILLVIGIFMFRQVIPDTVMAQRFQQLFDAGGGNAVVGFQENVRYWMYVDGFKLFLEHPIVGVGLGQFKLYHWSGLYSHSDYIEPLACTGLLGFILYQGFAFTVTLRLLRLLKRNLPGDLMYRLKGMLLFMLCNHYLIGLGGPHAWDMDFNVAIVFIGAHAWQIEQTIVKRKYLYMS